LSKLLKSLRAKRHESTQQDATAENPTIPMLPDVNKQIEATFSPPSRSEVPQYAVGCCQSIGRVRDHNEDSLLAITSLIASNGGFLPIGLFIIADGMGGHKLGEVASDLAIRTVAQKIYHKVLLPSLNKNPEFLEDSLQEIMSEGVQEAHQTITDEAPGSGTTLTALLVINKQLSIAHVGDSRAYAIGLDGKVEILTRDHSLVKRMIELGHLTEEEASVHPQRNVLYRALGQGDPFTPDVSTIPLPNSGYLLLCSDGLWGLVSQDEIVRIILNAVSPEIACQTLIDAANLSGGPDNISAIVVRLPQDPT
jgi:PPM family protein phosphatase